MARIFAQAIRVNAGAGVPARAGSGSAQYWKCIKPVSYRTADKPMHCHSEERRRRGTWVFPGAAKNPDPALLGMPTTWTLSVIAALSWKGTASGACSEKVSAVLVMSPKRFFLDSLLRDKVFNLAAGEGIRGPQSDTARGRSEGVIYGAGLRYREGPPSLLH
jgi:hypothetical protein